MKINKYWDDVWSGLKAIPGYELPETRDVLYLENLTQEHIHSKDRYQVKILLRPQRKLL